MEAETRFRFAQRGEQRAPVGTECDVTEMSAGQEPVEVATIGDITVKAFEVDHRPVMPAFGFRFERGGKSIVISGDTNACPGLLSGAQGADILVADSMNKKMMSALEDNLRKSGHGLQAAMLGDAHTYHADVKDAAEIAQQAGVKHLVLSHVMPSIMEEQIPQFTEGLSDIFKGEISVGHDVARYGIEYRRSAGRRHDYRARRPPLDDRSPGVDRYRRRHHRGRIYALGEGAGTHFLDLDQRYGPRRPLHRGTRRRDHRGDTGVGLHAAF